MIKFLFKGLMRDKSRSLLPIIIVAVGVMITVFLQAYMNGIFTDSIESGAKFTSGHVKVVTSAYKENLSQMPNDYAMTDIDVVLAELKTTYPNMEWTDRILFGGLLDAPDSLGMTRAQGNVGGAGIHLIGNDEEIIRMDLKTKLISGRFPEQSGEILLTNDLFKKMNLKLGDKVTLISSTMYGDMAIYNFTVCGTLHFGVSVLDRGMIYADIEDVRLALNMENAAGEILGFFKNAPYDNQLAKSVAAEFNKNKSDESNQFSYAMIPMSEIGGMDFMIVYAENAQFIIILIFVFAMSIVLWNAGLLGGLRRYGEFGLRLAIGENKNETYWSLVGEAVLVGLVGSVIGIAFGLLFSWLMQEYGIDAGDMIKDSTIIMPTVFRAQINTTTFFIGFIPGVLSTVIGAMLAGIGIYKRQTANLFKELQA
ncbi:MAG: FtsX-like permease family protein [Paludibacter sp.]|nr:FtsX-like permease family protein [Paludibacter sp.]